MTTLSESVALVASLSDELRASLTPAEALSVSAGTDAFQKHLVSILAKPYSTDTPLTQVASSVSDTKKAIVETGKAYVEETLEARRAVSEHGDRAIISGSTVIVPSYSDVVNALLRKAATANVEFQVFFVRDTNASSHSSQQRNELMSCLETCEIGAHTIEISQVAQLFQSDPPQLMPSSRNFGSSKVFVLTGASSLLASGGAVTSPNTQTTISVANAYNRPVIIATETAKCTKEHGVRSLFARKLGSSPADEFPKDMIDQISIVPPAFIRFFVTEEGLQDPSTIAERAFKKWS